VSLALAAAVKSLSYPDLERKERAFAFCVIGSCFSRLFDVLTAVGLMERQAVPEAERSGDPKAIVACYLRTAAYLNMCAVWSAGIPHYLTVGIKRPDTLASPAAYLQRALRYLDACESYGDMLPKDRPYFFAEKASAIALRDGYDHALPFLAQAHAVTSDLIPVTKPFLLLDHAVTARIAGRWDEALALIQEMQRLPAWHIYQRTVFFELSCIYRALGKDQEALQALQKFTELQTNMARLANSWVDDALNQQRYGKRLDLSRLRSSVLNAVEPATLQRANRYVESNLHRRIALSDVARHAGVSVRTLQTLYRNFHGVSASVFIKEQKMQRVHQMLGSGDVSVYQAADAIGYSSPHNFSRDFRERFGYAPSDARPSRQ
jgi:AraC-like DNA-binding protein